MNANEARLLAQINRKDCVDVTAAMWNQAKEYIYSKIKLAANNGYMSVGIDLTVERLAVISDRLKQMEKELKADGYAVHLYINGKREMIIKW